MSDLGWYFETFEGWSTLLKEGEPYFDWDSRGPDDVPDGNQKAEILRILNAHESMTAALEETRYVLVEVFNFSEKESTIMKIDAAIALAKGTPDGQEG